MAKKYGVDEYAIKYMVGHKIADITEKVYTQREFDWLKTEIEKLDPTEKQVITLRYVQGKSQSEVGKILGVSQMFVSRAERKIVEKLKEALIS